MNYSTFPSSNDAIHQPSPPTIQAIKRQSSGSSTSTLTRIHSSDLGPYDIVCGRCVNAYNNIGNRRFRVTIRLNLETYQGLESRHARSQLFVSLVRFLKNEVGVRFFKPIHDKQLNREGQWYIEMTENEARDKVGHAFRDMARTSKTQKQTTTAAEERMDATFSQVINQQVPVEPLPIPLSNNKTLDSMSNECPPPSDEQTQVCYWNLMTCDDFF